MSIHCGASFGGGQGYTDTCGKEVYGKGTPLAQCAGCMKGEIFQLKAENESLRKDAERYRWLRDNSVDPGTVIDKKVGVFNSEDGGYPIWEYRSGADLDSAIDAAISSSENPS